MHQAPAGEVQGLYRNRKRSLSPETNRSDQLKVAFRVVDSAYYWRRVS
jgi:hypothetical protein